MCLVSLGEGQSRLTMVSYIWISASPLVEPAQAASVKRLATPHQQAGGV